MSLKKNKNVENEYNQAKSTNNTTKMNEYRPELHKLKSQKEMMQKSMKYIFADDENIKNLKKN
ncbi:MAG: hypothetical protein ACLRQZ_07010 [Clostridia bacterium]